MANAGRKLLRVIHSDLILQQDFQVEGCLCLSWNRSAFDSPQLAIGSTSGASIWTLFPGSRRWEQSISLAVTSRVVDIDWAPNLGR